MKPYLLISIVVTCFFHSVLGQPLSVKNNFQSDLKIVIGDYPNHFKSLAGEKLQDNTQTADFACSVPMKDALECKVTKYSSTTKEIYSWQALMIKTEDFEEASKKFRSLYTSIQNITVNIGGSKYVLKGKYSQPTESMKFTSVIFDAGKENPQLQKLKVELLMEAEMLEWVVKVLVYEKEKEDDERGPSTDHR